MLAKFWNIVVALLFLISNLDQSFAVLFKDQRQLSTLYHKNLKQMTQMLDEDVEACDDFFHHACGYYEQTSDQLVDNSSVAMPPMLYNLEDRMHFFYEQRNSFSSDAGKFLSHLYSECNDMKGVFGSKDPIDFWRYLVVQLPLFSVHAEVYRGWPFLQYQWSEMQLIAVELNWVKLVAKLAAHGVATTFLHVFFAEHTIYVAPMEVAPNCANLTQIRDSLRTLLNGRNLQIADVIGHELFLFCDELNTKSEENADAVADNATDLLSDDILQNYFQEYFKHLNFSKSEVFKARQLVLGESRIRTLLRVFRKTDNRIIYNFALWRAYDALKSSLNDCFALTDEFEELLLAEYWQWNVFEQYLTRDVAMSSFQFHTTRFQQLRKSLKIAANWAAFLGDSWEGSGLDLTGLMTSYANEWLVPHVQTVYESVVWRQGAYFENLLQMRRLRLRTTFKQPHQDVDDPDHPHYFLRKFLHFSISIIKEPLFHYFATQGFDLWDESKLLSSSDGYYTALDCLEQQSRLNVDGSTSDPASLIHFLGEEEVFSIFNFYRAFVASLGDYQFWLQGEFFSFAEGLLLQLYGLDSQRIMFYAVAQQYCGRNDALFRGLINRSFMNVLHFAEAFNCSADAPMNPALKCMSTSCANNADVA